MDIDETNDIAELVLALDNFSIIVEEYIEIIVQVYLWKKNSSK